MAETPPLKLIPRTAEVAAITGPDARLVAEPDLAVVKVQILDEDPDSWIAGRTRVAAPASSRETNIGSVACAWLAPGEWLLTGPLDQTARIAERCRDDAGSLGLVVDLSHARASFELSGPAAKPVLSAHCPLDLREQAMPVGAAKRSLFSDTSFFLARKPDLSGHPVFRLMFDQTMAGYAVRMLGSTILGAVE